MLSGSGLYYKTIKPGKTLPFVQLQHATLAPNIATPKEHLYKQMTSNPAFIEREVYKEPMLISQRDKEAG